ncbi:putative Phosphatidylserine decarboxylase [Trypanosoma vivax]|uniref:Putative phosphatidylserine decarboxylase n=1 Tax=Trypanosoma vivax (strain Y486) TaxID=1055687 RepID=G0U2X1_TRYVY|nr:putative phosphatidylserine decarboxylase [Trypanosoma vivax]KAH8604256.1 putative Phosphatidylserine decarboxylase [Trypanosoma vivax]CCC50625.1 putative phosphatidylserine decarboxylase [Trypanosoma vivax Y486]
MLHKCQYLSFYRNNTHRPFTNPVRRWLYHYLFGGLFLGAGLGISTQYQLAAWEARYHPQRGERLCTAGMLELLTLLPFNYISNLFGHMCESTLFPVSFHHRLIDVLVWWYGVDLAEAKKETFSSLQDFFVREWKDGARMLSPFPIVAPSDGVVLSVQENVTDEQLVQVKGLSYSIRGLFHGSMPPVSEGQKRIAIVLHLRIQDFHHVITPCNFRCLEAIYIPGALMPHTSAGYHWIPAVLALNERVVLRGTLCEDWSGKGSIGIALVGGTLTGRIALHIDERIQTNFLTPPAYAIHRHYTSEPLLKKGDPLSTFYWGSSVVIVLDVPQNASISAKPGDVTKAGEALVTL